jgi:nucleoid-associated protein YgaU
MPKYTVQPGDTLDKIAEVCYGDPARSTRILDVNRIPDPSHLEVGQVLEIPNDLDATGRSRATDGARPDR